MFKYSPNINSMIKLQDAEVMEVNGGGWFRDGAYWELAKMFVEETFNAWGEYVKESQNGLYDGMPSPSFRH